MSVSNIISLLGGVALFLFGMTLMGEGLKKVAGNKMELVLILMMIFRPGGLLGSYDFSMSRLVERVLFGKKKKEGADHE